MGFLLKSLSLGVFFGPDTSQGRNARQRQENLGMLHQIRRFELLLLLLLLPFRWCWFSFFVTSSDTILDACVGDGPPAEPRHENFPWHFSSFAVQGDGNFGLKFLLKFFCGSQCPSKTNPKTSRQTSPQTLPKISPELPPLQNGNFAQNFALPKPFANAYHPNRNGCYSNFQKLDLPLHLSYESNSSIPTIGSAKKIEHQNMETARHHICI